jgi:hypothetical protein
MKLALPDHPQHSPASAVQHRGNLLDGQTQRFGRRWMEPSIEQECKAVFQRSCFLCDRIRRQVGEQVYRRFSVN